MLPMGDLLCSLLPNLSLQKGVSLFFLFQACSLHCWLLLLLSLTYFLFMDCLASFHPLSSLLLTLSCLRLSLDVPLVRSLSALPIFPCSFSAAFDSSSFSSLTLQIVR
jgi:hypothetical protein